MLSPESRRDAIARTVDKELYGWLMATASTAETSEELVDLYAGAVAGLSRFLWAMREDGTSVETLVAGVADGVRDFLTQAHDHERGGMA